MKFIRTADVEQMTGLSRSTLWRMEKAGRFPKRNRVIGNNAVRWLESDVIAWMQGKVEETQRKAEMKPENEEQTKKQLQPQTEKQPEPLLKFKYPKRRT